MSDKFHTALQDTYNRYVDQNMDVFTEPHPLAQVTTKP